MASDKINFHDEETSYEHWATEVQLNTLLSHTSGMPQFHTFFQKFAMGMKKDKLGVSEAFKAAADKMEDLEDATSGATTSTGGMADATQIAGKKLTLLSAMTDGVSSRLDQMQKSAARVDGTLKGAYDDFTSLLSIGAGVTGMLGSFGAGIFGVTGKLASAAKAGGVFGTAIKGASMAADAIPKFVGLMTTALGIVMGVVDDLGNSLRKTADFGIDFGSSFMTLRVELGRAGLGLDNLEKQLAQNSEAFALMGTNVHEGVRNFAAWRKEMNQMELVTKQNLGYFENLGFAMEDLHDMVLKDFRNRRLMGFSEREALDETTKRMQILAQETKKMSELTGESRKLLMQRNIEARSDPQWQIFLNTKTEKESKAFSDNLELMVTTLQMNPKQQKAMQDSIRMGGNISLLNEQVFGDAFQYLRYMPEQRQQLEEMVRRAASGTEIEPAEFKNNLRQFIVSHGDWLNTEQGKFFSMFGKNIIPETGAMFEQIQAYNRILAKGPAAWKEYIADVEMGLQADNVVLARAQQAGQIWQNAFAAGKVEQLMKALSGTELEAALRGDRDMVEKMRNVFEKAGAAGGWLTQALATMTISAATAIINVSDTILSAFGKGVGDDEDRGRMDYRQMFSGKSYEVDEEGKPYPGVVASQKDDRPQWLQALTKAMDDAGMDFGRLGQEYESDAREYEARLFAATDKIRADFEKQRQDAMVAWDKLSLEDKGKVQGLDSQLSDLDRREKKELAEAVKKGNANQAELERALNKKLVDKLGEQYTQEMRNGLFFQAQLAELVGLREGIAKFGNFLGEERGWELDKGIIGVFDKQIAEQEKIRSNSNISQDKRDDAIKAIAELKMNRAGSIATWQDQLAEQKKIRESIQNSAKSQELLTKHAGAPGSIYTHDIHLEELLKSQLATMLSLDTRQGQVYNIFDDLFKERPDQEIKFPEIDGYLSSMFDDFKGTFAPSIGNMFDSIPKLNWDKFITKLEYDLPEFDWNKYISEQEIEPLDWDKFITKLEYDLPKLEWNNYISNLEIPEGISEFDWNNYISNLEMPTGISEFDWNNYISKQEIEPLNWNQYLDNLEMPAGISEFDWNNYISKQEIEPIKWNNYIAELEYDIPKIPEIDWNEYIPKLEYSIPKFDWGKYIGMRDDPAALMPELPAGITKEVELTPLQKIITEFESVSRLSQLGDVNVDNKFDRLTREEQKNTFSNLEVIINRIKELDDQQRQQFETNIEQALVPSTDFQDKQQTIDRRQLELLEAIILAIRGVKEGVTTTNSKFEQLINAKS